MNKVLLVPKGKRGFVLMNSEFPAFFFLATLQAKTVGISKFCGKHAVFHLQISRSTSLASNLVQKTDFEVLDFSTYIGCLPLNTAETKKVNNGTK